MKFSTGQSLGLAVCRRCCVVTKIDDKHLRSSCPRCGASVAVRSTYKLSRSLAYLIAAYILYIPANVLPVMQTSTLLGSEADTILSGVMVLIRSGSWPLGMLVFFASIVVPLLKLIGLSFLIVSVKMKARWAPMQRTKLFRLIEFVGRWSMLDIYVVTLLVGLVQIRTLATIQPGKGAAAFGAVVVLTMLSAMNFDPRLIWDPVGERNDKS